MKLNKRDQQLADYQEEMKMIGPQKQPASVNQINAQQKQAASQISAPASLDSPQYKLITAENYDLVVHAMVRAFLELNTIRARDGVPYTRAGWRSDVTDEYFSSVVDSIDKAVIAMTGKSAHCHPALYGNTNHE